MKQNRIGGQKSFQVQLAQTSSATLLLQREVWQRTHSHDEGFLAFDFKENHQEESEMMFDKNGRQEEISLHYKNKERESLHKKIEWKRHGW